jgi:hypothetical protein
MARDAGSPLPGGDPARGRSDRARRDAAYGLDTGLVTLLPRTSIYKRCSSRGPCGARTAARSG